MNSFSAKVIDYWLTQLRLRLIENSPELLSLFDTCASEAVFGRRFIANDLKKLKPGSTILEVGAGSLLLSCQLVREGFRVTALEPSGIGFSHFDRLRQIVIEEALLIECCPEIIFLRAEMLSETCRFDYAFSINVMEHVENIPAVIRNVATSLRVGAVYHFTCPNYIFPYEPHFNIPTLFSKKLTETIFRKIIFNSKRVTDPKGTWKSLNWINVIIIRRYAKRLNVFLIEFNKSIMTSAMERIVSDQKYAARRSPSLRFFLAVLVHFRLHRAFRFMPIVLQPIIDCSLIKLSDKVGSEWHRGQPE